MSEENRFNIFNPSLYLELLPSALLIQAQIEGEELARRQERACDFVRRYPHGVNPYGMPELPQQKPITLFIPAWFEEVLW
jgi:hypothetical protein